MGDIEYVPVDASHAADARTTIARAFAVDPLIEWLFPAEMWKDGERLDHIATFYWPSVETYAAQGAGHVAVDGDRVVGVALWGVPNSGSPAQTLPSASGVARLLLGDRLGELAEGMRVARGDTALPSGPYLHDLAVTADRRGEGIGTALIEAGLRDFGRNGAWLETTNPRNQGLYERAGFEGVHAGPIGNSGVTMTRMAVPS
ncbi:N-acetyltransferase [Brevibacterium sp. LS14]|uniref:GCN5-like N-acetyltransferase n=1 Tax=Brevibacterium casei S18 TaxID=1229781 RepID=K9AXH2_9MICO|nr:GNAT family N-acetyltransferase [Brevibacterium casei]EKU47262.1 GCN5-like N-acetyltransferase [Brevibacterium casei S18]NJE66709.1 N-acetyltransferase [Brevibacterium sp. LS14]NNV08744.1 N-acetyltransferase [Geobacillus sp. MMMUD3]QQT69446.1 GNAT family N-acetyltransferase [Brevibacterium casei]